MYKVIIIDDHESMCDSLTYALNGTGEFSIIGTAPAAAHAEVFCEKLQPDLVVMDVCTEGNISGLDAAEKLRKKFPQMKIVIMSGFDEITYVPRTKEIGAHAFVYKSKSLAYFIEVLQSVMQGATVYPEEKMIPLPMGEVPLTVREMEVLRLMCKHMTNAEIAEELFISEGTVKYHKTNILGKTGFSKSLDLVFYMLTKGWINPLH